MAGRGGSVEHFGQAAHQAWSEHAVHEVLADEGDQERERVGPRKVDRRDLVSAAFFVEVNELL